jgi:hypothetical protein
MTRTLQEFLSGMAAHVLVFQIRAWGDRVHNAFHCAQTEMRRMVRLQSPPRLVATIDVQRFSVEIHSVGQPRNRHSVM